MADTLPLPAAPRHTAIAIWPDGKCRSFGSGDNVTGNDFAGADYFIVASRALSTCRDLYDEKLIEACNENLFDNMEPGEVAEALRAWRDWHQTELDERAPKEDK